MPTPTTPDPHQPAPADATAQRERAAVEALRGSAPRTARAAAQTGPARHSGLTADFNEPAHPGLIAG